MKKLIITGIALLLPMLASAHFFHYQADYQDDNGFFYLLNSEDLTAKITYNGYAIDDEDYVFYASYSGNIIIPSSFVNRNDGLTYTVTGIDQYAFYKSKDLTSVEIPNSVTSIGKNAFMGLSGLTSISIPNSVTIVEPGAFSGTGWFNSQPDGVVYAGNIACGYKGITLGTNVIIQNGTVGIAEEAFYGCTNLSSITIPASVKYIGECAFASCTNLKSVDIPDGMTSIGYNAFSGSGLTSISIPNSVTYIGAGAFECENLLSVTSYITEPFTADGWGPFSENTYRKGTLYVPVDTKEIYSRIDGWREFLKIVEMEGVVYDLSIQDSSNGTIDLKVKKGNTCTLKISPKEGKTLLNVFFNNADVTSQLDSEKKYTTPAITANSTLRIVYKEDKRGDLNGDDKVNVADHVELTKIIMEQ